MKSGIRYRFFTGKETTAASPAHMMHIQAAHTLLESVKRDKAISDIEQLSRVITMSDGTTIRALSSLGFEDIRITVPPPPPVPKPVEEVEEKKKKKEEEEEPEEEGFDYLWIGIRPVQPINSEAAGLDGAYSVCGLLIEPDGVHTLLGDAGYYETNEWMHDSAGPMSDPTSFAFSELESYKADATPFFSEAKALPTGYEPLSVTYKNGPGHVGGVRFSTSGVIGYCVVHNAYGLPSTTPLTVENTLLPPDPKAPMLDATYPDGQLSDTPNPDAWWGDPKWHNVFLLDPLPSIIPIGNLPLRTQDEQIRAVVADTIGKLYGTSIQVKTGEYILKVLMYGDCRPNKGSSIDVEIEVRIGKPYHKTWLEFMPQTVFRTTVPIAWWSRYPRAIFPYGGRNASHEQTGSPNPHGPMWWQGGLSINVKNRTAEQIDSQIPEVAAPGMGAMFEPGEWAAANDKCSAIVWYPYMLSSFYPGSVPIGETLEAQAHNFARTFYYAIWYGGDQGWDYSYIDWSRYNLAPIEAAIAAYAASAGRTNLNGTKIIASGYPADLGTRPDPVITILEISTTSSDEWTTLVNSGQIYNGIYHHMSIVF